VTANPNDYFYGALFAACEEDDTYSVADMLRDLDTYFHRQAANRYRPNAQLRRVGRVRLKRKNLKRAYKAHLSM